MKAVPVNARGDSVARDVSGDQVVGYACTAGNASCARVLVQGGRRHALPSLGGNSAANAINWAEAQTVGSSASPSPPTAREACVSLRQWRRSPTSARWVDRTARRSTSTRRGDVVGVSDVPGGGTHAFLWRNGTMFDLNTATAVGIGLGAAAATGISDAGQIVGVGTFDGATRGFLLTPPADLSVWPGGQRSQEDSNLPRGVEVGRDHPLRQQSSRRRRIR